MMFRFLFTDRFRKHYKKLSTGEKKQVENKLKFLAEKPSRLSLRVKKIKGTDDLFECSVNMDIRIIWLYEGTEIIVILDVGHHDIVNQY